MSKNKPRIWTISGGETLAGITYINCDGFVPKINERVRAIEYSAYEELLAQTMEMREILANYVEDPDWGLVTLENVLAEFDKWRGEG